MFTKIKAVKSQIWFLKIIKAISEDVHASFSNKVIFYDAYCCAQKGHYDQAMQVIARSKPAAALFKVVNSFASEHGLAETYTFLPKIVSKFSYEAIDKTVSV